jgi:hypothetical protein
MENLSCVPNSLKNLLQLYSKSLYTHHTTSQKLTSTTRSNYECARGAAGFRVILSWLALVGDWSTEIRLFFTLNSIPNEKNQER